MIERAIVFLIVIVTLGLLIRSMIGALRGRRSGGCSGGCEGCPQVNAKAAPDRPNDRPSTGDQ